MKRILTTFITIATFATITAITSCTKEVDKCANVTCQNGGTCVTGTCNCAAGYEGSNCETLMRAKFIGQFQGPETCTVGSDNYTLTVATSSTDVVKVTFTNVYNQTYVVTASVSGSSFTVASQTVATNVTVSGSGTISGTNNNTLTFTYAIATLGGATNTCTFTGTKL